jgi:threonyl-tRNA synthetase
VLLVVGKKEAAERTISLRRLGTQDQQIMPMSDAIALLAEEAIPPDLRRAGASDRHSTTLERSSAAALDESVTHFRR